VVPPPGFEPGTY